jgi:hypothetical protein
MDVPSTKQESQVKTMIKDEKDDVVMEITKTKKKKDKKKRRAKHEDLNDSPQKRVRFDLS